MKDLLDRLKSEGLTTISTSRLCQILSVPEWHIADLLAPLIQKGQLSFYGENSFGIDIWLISVNSSNEINTESFSLARLKRASNYWKKQPKLNNHELVESYFGIIKRQGFTSELVCQAIDCMHLLAKGKSEFDIVESGYSLRLEDIKSWQEAISQVYKMDGINVDTTSKFVHYKIIDRLATEEPKVIGVSNTANLNSILMLLGLFVSDLDEVQIDEPLLVRYLVACRFIFVPLTKEEEDQYQLMKTIDEPVFMAFYENEAVISRACLLKVIETDSPPTYVEWSAESEIPGQVDFLTSEIADRILNYNRYGHGQDLLNSRQKALLLELKSNHEGDCITSNLFNNSSKSLRDV